MPTVSIDLNADLGEGFPWDDALLDRVSSASISCGAHAGDPESIRRTLAAAKAKGVVVGAHPGYADRDHFGRKDLDLPDTEIRDSVREQVSFLASIASETGDHLRFIKPHGALYNQAQRDPSVASALVDALLPLGLPILGQPGTCLESSARECGLPFVAEGFADRRYGPEGRLVPRSEPGAVLVRNDEIEEQLRTLVSGGSVRTICIHGDNPDSVRLADLVLKALQSAGITIRSFA